MNRLVAALALVLAASCSPEGEQAKTSATPEAATSVQTASQSVDPASIAALNRMGAYLRTLTNFEVRARTSIDEVLIDNGQKIQFSGEGLYKVRRPSAFYLETKTDRRQRRFYFDGKTFTIYSPRLNVYAQRAAPGTIAEMVTQMEENYGIEVPLADLFYWGSADVKPAEFQLASHIGFARVNGQASDQYALRQGTVDWQVWIARGPRPLPLKVIVTSYEEPGQPQFVSELTWNLNPLFNPRTFAFQPGKDVHQIQIAAN